MDVSIFVSLLQLGGYLCHCVNKGLSPCWKVLFTLLTLAAKYSYDVFEDMFNKMNTYTQEGVNLDELEMGYSELPKNTSMYLPNPFHHGQSVKKSISKQSKAVLNSSFSFSLTGCLIRAKEHSKPYYLPIAGSEKRWICAFVKGTNHEVKCKYPSKQVYFSHTSISAKKSQNSIVGNRCGNLLSFLLRCGTRPYERGTQWDSNSLV